MLEDVDRITDDQNPLHQNLQIFRKRLIKIMDRFVDKIAIATCIEELLDNNAILIRHLYTERELQALFKSYKNFEQIPVSQSQRNKTYYKSTKSKLKTGKFIQQSQIIVDAKQEANLSNLITMLHHKHEVRHIAYKLLDLKSLQTVEFFYLVKALHDFVIKKFYVNATEDAAYKKRIANSYNNNEKYKLKYEEISKINEAKMSDLLTKITEINKIVEEQEAQKLLIKKQCKEELLLAVIEAENQMAFDTLTSQEKRAVLAEEAKLITQQYQNLLENNIKSEKALRVKRFKIETQLASWLAKYDQEIGDLNAQYETIYDGYSKEKAQYDDLKIEFDEQEVTYLELMKEKSIEDERIWALKYFKWMQKRSVRIISNWWWNILNKRREKRKARIAAAKAKKLAKKIAKI